MKTKYYVIEAQKQIGRHYLDFSFITSDEMNRNPMLICDKIFLNWFDDDNMKNPSDYKYKHRRKDFSITVHHATEIPKTEFKTLFK